MGTRGAVTGWNRCLSAPALASPWPGEAVRRERLLSLLDAAATQRLTIVVAPAGYGKTVVLEQWATAHTARVVSWLTITPKHNDPASMAADLQQILARTSATVVLDDFDVLTDAEALDEVAATIEQLPPGRSIILATRADPPLRYYRLRLSDDLAEVRAADLAFAREEAADLLARACGTTPDPTQVDSLVARTDGWAFGLACCGDDDRVDEFLTTEVLDHQSAEVRRFLLSTSALERMTGSLCDFATDGRRSHAFLDELERTGAFVVPPHASHPWFTYHPMFRALLRRQCRIEDAAVESDVLHRAAEWHLARGEIEDGVRCLVEAGARDEVVEAAFTYGPAMLDRQRGAEVAGWLESVAPDPAENDARVSLVEAASLLFGDGDTTAARRALDEIGQGSALSVGEHVVADLLRAIAALFDGADSHAAAAASRVLDRVGVVDDAELPNLLGLTGTCVDVTAGALVARGVAGLYAGDLSLARQDFEGVAEEAHGRWRASALGSLALAEAWCGNLTKGEELAGRALALADELGHDAHLRTTALLALALVARERGDLDRAVELLEDVERTGGTRRRVVGVWVATERAHLALATDRPVAGRTVLGGPRASLHPSIPDGVLARRRAAEAQVLLASGDLDAAEEALDFGFGGETSEVRTARVLLALERGDTSGARAVVDGWPEEPHPRGERERRLCVAILDHLEGHEREACAAMADVVAEADAEGDVGLFEPAGNYALGPARALYRTAPTAFLRNLVDRPMAARQAKPVKGLAEQLTDREYMVLAHLPSRQSNAEIAERMDVSLNTVKTHLKHIYRKLDVVGRSAAVDAAERLHVL